jgi:hypothetical protein
MSEEQSPEMEDIKIRLGDDIPVEEDVEALKAEQESADVVGEFKNLGKQFGETLRTAWKSEERVRFETEVREGVRGFATEVDKAFTDLKESDVGSKARKEAGEVKSKVEASEVTDQARAGFAQGLHWFSLELEKLSDHFTTTAEKSPEDIADSED